MEYKIETTVPPCALCGGAWDRKTITRWLGVLHYFCGVTHELIWLKKQRESMESE